MSRLCKVSYCILLGIVASILIFLLLERHAAVVEIGIFSLRNIIEVSLFFIIGVPVIYIIRKYILKSKDEETL
jgi:hypothetical protein